MFAEQLLLNKEAAKWRNPHEGKCVVLAGHATPGAYPFCPLLWLLQDNELKLETEFSACIVLPHDQEAFVAKVLNDFFQGHNQDAAENDPTAVLSEDDVNPAVRHLLKRSVS